MNNPSEFTTTGHSAASGSNRATGLREVLTLPYRSYLYSYPHKTAYRELDPPLPLGPLWERENTDTYFYICIFLLRCPLRILQSVHFA